MSDTNGTNPPQDDTDLFGTLVERANRGTKLLRLWRSEPDSHEGRAALERAITIRTGLIRDLLEREANTPCEAKDAKPIEDMSTLEKAKTFGCIGGCALLVFVVGGVLAALVIKGIGTL